MSNSSWWAERLHGRAVPPAPQQQVQPQNYQQPQQQQQPYNPQQQGQPQGYQQPQAQPAIQSIHDIPNAMGYWQGGEATKTELEHCPKCGSGHYFSRTGGNLRGPAPAPLCYTCGHNGVFEQAQGPAA